MRCSIPTGASTSRTPASTLSIASSEFFIASSLLLRVASAAASSRETATPAPPTRFVPEPPPSPPSPAHHSPKAAEHGALPWAISPAHAEPTSSAVPHATPRRPADFSPPGSLQTPHQTAPAATAACGRSQDSTQSESTKPAYRARRAAPADVRAREQMRPAQHPRPRPGSVAQSEPHGTAAPSASPRDSPDRPPTANAPWKTTPNCNPQ